MSDPNEKERIIESTTVTKTTTTREITTTTTPGGELNLDEINRLLEERHGITGGISSLSGVDIGDDKKTTSTITIQRFSGDQITNPISGISLTGQSTAHDTQRQTSAHLPGLNETIVIEKAFDKPLTNQPQIIHQKTTIKNVTSSGKGPVKSETITKTTITGPAIDDSAHLLTPEDFINPDNLTAEQAAIRIQAAFRGYEVRKSLSREPSPYTDGVGTKKPGEQKISKSKMGKLDKPQVNIKIKDNTGDTLKQIEGDLKTAIDDASEAVDAAAKEGTGIIERLFGRKKRSVKKPAKPDVELKTDGQNIDSIGVDDEFEYVYDESMEKPKFNVKPPGIRLQKHQTMDRPKSPTKKIVIKRSHSLDKYGRRPDMPEGDITGKDGNGGIFSKFFGKKKKTGKTPETSDLQWEYKTGDISAKDVVDISKTKGVGLKIPSPKVSPETNVLMLETKSYSLKDKDGNVTGNFVVEQIPVDVNLSGTRPAGQYSKMIAGTNEPELSLKKQGKIN